MDRGLVASVMPHGTYVSWRLLESDPAGVGFDLWRRVGGRVEKVNAAPIVQTSDFFLPGFTDRAAEYSVDGKTFTPVRGEEIRRRGERRTVRAHPARGHERDRLRGGRGRPRRRRRIRLHRQDARRRHRPVGPRVEARKRHPQAGGLLVHRTLPLAARSRLEHRDGHLVLAVHRGRPRRRRQGRGDRQDRSARTRFPRSRRTRPARSGIPHGHRRPHRQRHLLDAVDRAYRARTRARLQPLRLAQPDRARGSRTSTARRRASSWSAAPTER